MPNRNGLPMLMGDFHYSRKFNYIYVATRKVACSTIKHMLQTAEIGEIQSPDPVSHINEFGYSEFLMGIHDAKKWTLLHPRTTADIERFRAEAKAAFCFVRNPYTRILSAFLDKIAANENRRKLFLGPTHSTPITLKNFLEVVADQDPDQMDGHWRPQARHLASFGVKYSLVGSFERLEADLATVISAISPRILNFRRDVLEHRTSAAGFLNLIDQDSIELIQMIYRDDFEQLGYSLKISECLKPCSFSADLPFNFRANKVGGTV